nr:ATP synthase F0 subunit 8 [Pseudomicrodon sp.]
MPQMAPMNWLSLFVIFLLTFIMFNILNYFHYFPTNLQSTNLSNMKFKTMNWKW